MDSFYFTNFHLNEQRLSVRVCSKDCPGPMVYKLCQTIASSKNRLLGAEAIACQ